MKSLNRIPPVKTAVHRRIAHLSAQSQRAQEAKQALIVDPLMLLSEVVPMLGNPSYTTLRSWIKKGTLRCWRAGRGHYRVRLSEIQRFLTAHEVHHG